MSEIILEFCKKRPNDLIKDSMLYEAWAVLTSLNLASGLAKFVRMSGLLCPRGISPSVAVSRTKTEYVRKNITNLYRDVVHPERDLYMRLAF